jgi:Spy/CpxP family protein refolding chaperone
MSGNKMLDRMATRLDLTDTQKSQVKSIVGSEAAADAPTIDQMKQDVTSLRAMADSDTVDQSKLTDVAQSTSSTAVDLIVDLARTKSRIYTVLTPEQRAKQKDLQAQGLATLKERLAKMQGKQGRLVSFVASRLDLSDDQISQAKSILATRRQNAKPEIAEIAQDLKGIQALTQNGSFDEQAVHAQAEKAQQPIEDLIVGSIQTRSQLFALLTPDQQEKVEKMQHSFRAKLAERIMERFSHQDDSDTQSVI